MCMNNDIDELGNVFNGEDTLPNHVANPNDDLIPQIEAGMT